MVGKRERDCKNPMRRTTSMTEFAPPDALAAVMEDEEEAQLPYNSHISSRGAAAGGGQQQQQQQDWLSAFVGGGAGPGGAAAQEDWLAAYRARAAPALAGLRRNSADFSAAETAAFLRACGLCNRRLGPGRDTFMYRGDTAFCSLECRQQHMTIEEWKEKCALATPPTTTADPVVPLPLPPSGGAAGSDKPAGTLTAAS